MAFLIHHGANINAEIDYAKEINYAKEIKAEEIEQASQAWQMGSEKRCSSYWDSNGDERRRF